MKQTIIRIIKELIIKDVNEDQKLISSGLLDSVAMVQLVLGLESELEIEIALDDLTQENFETVSKISQLIKR